MKKEHGHENDADAKHRYEGRRGNLIGAIQNGWLDILALLQVVIDVFDGDGGLVDQNAHGERQPTQSHYIKRLAESG